LRFPLWIRVTAKAVMGAVSGALFEGPDLKDLGRQEHQQKESAEKTV
jgi:hypothetical protein